MLTRNHRHEKQELLLRHQAVVPGAAVLTLPESGRLRVGGGLQPDGQHLVASKAGVLRATKAGKLWVEGRQKRWAPERLSKGFYPESLNYLPRAPYVTVVSCHEGSITLFPAFVGGAKR